MAPTLTPRDVVCSFRETPTSDGKRDVPRLFLHLTGALRVLITTWRTSTVDQEPSQ